MRSANGCGLTQPQLSHPGVAGALAWPLQAAAKAAWLCLPHRGVCPVSRPQESGLEPLFFSKPAKAGVTPPWVDGILGFDFRIQSNPRES